MKGIIEIDKLKELIVSLKNQKKSIVLVGGCFDILHYGHIKFLREAKSWGDVLLVALESDERVTQLKGMTRPFHKQVERAEILAQLLSVDYVLMLPEMKKDAEYESLVEMINPNIIALTEGDHHKEKKLSQARKINARVEIIPKVKTQSSSVLAKLLGLD